MILLDVFTITPLIYLCIGLFGYVYYYKRQTKDCKWITRDRTKRKALQ